jgi:uncharacterized membrane protein YidH (DUF202 family)
MIIQRLKSIQILLLLSLFLASCGTSNVVSNRLIQKRKYNKGWHINLKKKNKSNNESANSERKFNFGGKSAAIDVNHGSKKEVSTQDLNESIAKSNPVIEEQSPLRKQGESDEIETAATVLKVNHSDEVEEDSQARKRKEPIEPDYLDNAKRAYKKSWMYTVLAIFAITAGIILFVNAYIGLQQIFGGILLVMAVFFYVMMFINLIKTANGIVHYRNSDSYINGTDSTLHFLTWGHIAIGSLVSILLFLIPLLICITRVRRTRLKYSD